MIFNGIDLSPYLRIKEIHGRGISSSELTLIEVPAMDGAYYSQKRRPPRVIEIEADIRASNREELRTKLDQLNAILDVDQPVPIVFPDEPNMIYYGIPEATGEDNEYTFLHQGILTIVCPDPFKYGTELEATFPSDVVSITNNGTADADPVFELEVLQPVTFAMIQNQNDEYMMIGRPINVDENTPYERYERIFYTDAESLTGWTTAATGEIDGTIAGSMEAVNSRFQAASYGTGSGWHGPAIKTSLAEVLTDFRMDTFVAFYNKNVAKQVGRVELYLLDVNGNQVAKVAIKDTNAGRSLGWGEARAGDSVDNHYLINEYGDKPGNWNDFFGVLRIERVGNRWYAYFAMQDPATRRHHTRRSVEWVDTENKYTRTVAQVVVHMGQYGTNEPVVGGVYSISVYKINPEQSNQVPYIAQAGDIITFDHRINDLLINGESRKDIKDFGASYFKLKKGYNTLAVYPSDSFNVKCKYSERFK